MDSGGYPPGLTEDMMPQPDPEPGEDVEPEPEPEPELVDCTDCGGSGQRNFYGDDCRTCGGEGECHPDKLKPEIY